MKSFNALYTSPWMVLETEMSEYVYLNDVYLLTGSSGSWNSGKDLQTQ